MDVFWSFTWIFVGLCSPCVIYPYIFSLDVFIHMLDEKNSKPSFFMNKDVLIDDHGIRHSLDIDGYLLDGVDRFNDVFVDVRYGLLFRRLVLLSRFSGRSMKEIHVLLPEEVHDVLREMSKEMGVSLAELVRRFVASGLGMDVSGVRRNLVKEIDDLRSELRELREWQRVIDNKLDFIVSSLNSLKGDVIISSAEDGVSSGLGSSVSSSGGVDEKKELFGVSRSVDSGLLKRSGSSSFSSRRMSGRSGSPYESVILEVMSSDPFRVWHWEEIYDGVVERVGSANRSTIKDRVNRMSKEGLLVKVSRGRYMLPSEG